MSTETKPPHRHAITGAAVRVEAYLTAGKGGSAQDVPTYIASNGGFALARNDLTKLVAAGNLYRPLVDDVRELEQRAEHRHRRLRSLAREWRSGANREQGLALDALLDEFEDEERA